MNRELGLRILSQIMDWDDDEAREEFRWLTFMSAYKYDGYRDFLAGARFIESLAKWLQQFSKEDRATAYDFIKNQLIYFSPPEIQRLVEKFFPERVQPDLVERVAAKLGIPKYQVWASKKSINEINYLGRKTLFMGLSDGAQVDFLRRANVGTISNEQIVIATQIDKYKWTSLLKDLRSDLSELCETPCASEKFSRVYLVDDFTASGTSFIRDPNKNGIAEGKLTKFGESLTKAKTDLGGESPFEDGFSVSVHHYIGTELAQENIEKLYLAAKPFFEKFGIAKVEFTFGMLLTANIALTSHSDDPFADICRRYYDAAIEGDGKHGGQSGVKSKMFGYAGCGLPVVLEHNTPNNSLPLLHAETLGADDKHPMRPLFRRRERHSDLSDVAKQ